jgi:hypothetical protein
LPEHLGHRKEGRVLEERAGASFDPSVRRCRDRLLEAPHQPGFTNTGFADDRDDLSFTLAGPFPPAQQRTQLFFAADERS